MKSIDYENMPSQWRGTFGDDIDSPTKFSRKPASERMTNYEKSVAEKALNNHRCTLPRNYYKENVSIGFQSQDFEIPKDNSTRKGTSRRDMFMKEVQEALNEVDIDKDEVAYKICMDGISQIQMNLKARGVDLSGEVTQGHAMMMPNHSGGNKSPSKVTKIAGGRYR